MAGRYLGVLGTAGHIDHGKSTLIKALTGTDPDRLKEERERGITIELGFAELELPGEARLGVVDVPGHEKFVRHMVAGATGIDIALLVVAADDGVMVQTREHLAILELLGVPRLVVALSKCDRADLELTELARADISALLEETPWPGAPIVAVSAVSGEGLDELRAAIARAAGDLERRAASRITRLPIDRVFSIEGAGTVVTGTLWEGRIVAGDRLELVGRDTELRIRQIQEHGRGVDEARAGQRVALNLAGVGCGELARGMILATPGALRPVRRFNAWFSYGADPARPRRLKTPATVHLHHGTSEVMARLLLLGESGELAPGAAGFIQLRADEALAVRAGDRFIVRAGDPLYSIGGGVVLDTTPRLRTRLSEADRALLEALRDGEAPRSVRLALERSRVAVTSEQVATELGCERSEVTSVLNSCPETEVCRFKRDRETVWLSSAAAEQLRATIVETLRSWHEDNPQQTGLATGALCDLVCARQRTDPETFVLMLQQLEEAGTVTKAGGKVALASAAASVQATLDELCQRIAERVQGQGLSPEGPTALQAALGVERSLLAQALGILTREDRLIRLGGDLYFSPAAIEQAKDALTQALRRAPDGLTAAELRDVLGVSRKYAIPLLEHFDARGVTLRVGDLRQLR